MPKKPKKTAFDKIKEHWIFQADEKDVNKILKLIEKVFSTVRGKVDVKSRLMLLSNPDNILTSTILTPQQVDFVAISNFVGEKFEMFEPLKSYATESFAPTNISKGGIGREQSISLVSAMQESKLLSRMGLIAEKSKGVE